MSVLRKKAARPWRLIEDSSDILWIWRKHFRLDSFSSHKWDVFRCGPNTRYNTHRMFFWDASMNGVLAALGKHSWRDSSKFSTKLRLTSSEIAAIAVASVLSLKTPPCEQPDQDGRGTLFMDGSAACTSIKFQLICKFIVFFCFVFSFSSPTSFEPQLKWKDPFLCPIFIVTVVTLSIKIKPHWKVDPAHIYTT